MNQPPLVTLIDPDPQGLATLNFAFGRAGFTVAGTSDLGMAAALAHGTGARLAVVSMGTPEAPSLALLADLRKGREGAELPVLALGPAASRDAAIDAGAFDFLETPLFVRDAIAISRLLLLMRTPSANREDPPEIDGSLDDLHGLYFLMRAMKGAFRSGVLQLSRGKRTGEVRFFEGAVTSAQVRALQAFPALHQLLLWRGAAFSLKLRSVPQRAQFSATGAEILEECERFLRDVAHAAKQLGSLNTVFTHDGRQAGARAAEVPPEVAPVARLFDGVRTLGEVIEESPFRIFDTLRVVKRLVDSHAVMARAPSAPTVAMVREAMGSQPTPAPPRARVKTVSHGVPPAAPETRSPDAPLDERRAGAGERRKSPRRTPMPFEKPAAKPAPAPIPLVTKKSPSGGFAMGEIRASKVARPTPMRGSAGTARGPTVHVNQEPVALSRDNPRPSPAVAKPAAAPTAEVPAAAPTVVAPAAGPPVSARQLPVPARHTPSRPAQAHAKAAGRTPVPGAAPFNALEADFFAREADLYKNEGGDTFEDLEHGAEGNATSRAAGAAIPRATSRTKKRS